MGNLFLFKCFLNDSISDPLYTYSGTDIGVTPDPRTLCRSKIYAKSLSCREIVGEYYLKSHITRVGVIR